MCLLAFAVLATVLFADVLSREFSGTGLHWSGQLGVYANIALVMAGFGLATTSGNHLRPRFVDAVWPASFEPVVEVVRYLLTTVFLAVLTVVSGQVALESFEFGERSVTLGWPVWLFQSLLPLEFAVAALKNLCFAIWPEVRPSEASSGDTVSQTPLGQS